MTGPCPRPENMNRGYLEQLMEARGLDTNGTLNELIERYTQDDKSRFITLLQSRYLIVTVWLYQKCYYVKNIENFRYDKV